MDKCNTCIPYLPPFQIVQSYKLYIHVPIFLTSQYIYHIFPFLSSIISVIHPYPYTHLLTHLFPKGVTCNVELMCYGFDAAGNTGHLTINGAVEATWTSTSGSQTGRRKKRQATNHGDGWHIFSFTSSCAPADSLHLSLETTTGNEYRDEFANFVRVSVYTGWGGS